MKRSCLSTKAAAELARLRDPAVCELPPETGMMAGDPIAPENLNDGP